MERRFRERAEAVFERLLGRRRAGFDVLARHMDLLVAGLWFIVAFSATLWMWGPRPVVFPTPDEATNRLAALLVGKNGTPFLELPFADVEDLAHLRPWRSIGPRAIPIYPPVTFYLYGLLTRVGSVGYFLIAMLPAAAVAAFACGTAQLLPSRRRWLALLAPALGFPGLYWLLRPWMNLSLLLVCLCWSLLFWACWRRFGGTGWLAAALLSVGAAAAVRPDYAAFLLSSALLFSLAASPPCWKLIFVFALGAGACAVAVNLVLNQVINGDPWRAGYQLVMDSGPGEPPRGAWQLVRLLLLPAGMPAPSDALTWFVRYWLKMGPISVLVLAQLTLVPLLRAEAWRSRVLYSAGLAVVLLLVLTRMYGGFQGAMEPVGLVNHSLPRYWAPVYFFAALPPIVFLGRCKPRAVLFAGSALMCALAYLSVDEICARQPTSFRYLESFVRSKTRWLGVAARTIPVDAIVYSEKEDKLVWSRWQVALIGSASATATSMKRALAAGRPVFILDRGFARTGRRLVRELHRKNLAVVKVNVRLGVYRVEVPEPEARLRARAHDEPWSKLPAGAGTAADEGRAFHSLHSRETGSC